MVWKAESTGKPEQRAGNSMAMCIIWNLRSLRRWTIWYQSSRLKPNVQVGLPGENKNKSKIKNKNKAWISPSKPITQLGSDPTNCKATQILPISKRSLLGTSERTRAPHVHGRRELCPLHLSPQHHRWLYINQASTRISRKTEFMVSTHTIINEGVWWKARDNCGKQKMKI